MFGGKVIRAVAGALLVVALSAVPASAQQQPPPTGPGGQAPPQGPGPGGPGGAAPSAPQPSGPPPSPATTAAGGTAPPSSSATPVQLAALPLAREAALLIALGAFTGPERLRPAVAGATPPPEADRTQLSGELTTVDRAGASQLAALTGAGSPLSPDIQSSLGALSDADRAAAAGGTPISVEPEAYLRALDQLLHANGAGTGAPPDAARIARSLAALQAGGPVAGSTPGATTVLTPAGDGGGGGLPGWLPFVVLFGLLAGGAEVARRQGMFSRTTTVGGATRGGPAVVPPARLAAPDIGPTPMQPPSGPDVRDLLEVSRRLTSAAASGDIDRAVIRDALELVPARGAALIRQDGDALSIISESHPGLLVAEKLGEGMVRRVAETGQPMVQVSATEPAIRNLPASLAAVPLVGGGRVESVLLMIRNGNQPFTTAERDLLSALAPVAAAALHNARQTKAAIEDSLIDPLTQVGNRRRLDAELPKRLAGEGPTSLFIVDLDHFKLVNDVHGHQAGDALLRGVANLLGDTVRPGDSVYRYGGEEFCVVMPSTTSDAAVEVAERVRAALAAKAFSIGKADPLTATASFGVSTSTDTDAAALIARADAALYEAKEAGRNRVHTR